jgi:hypothetical protein
MAFHKCQPALFVLTQPRSITCFRRNSSIGPLRGAMERDIAGEHRDGDAETRH